VTTLQALILGIVQGLTEFLPVSSSGHLVIFQNLLGINEPPLDFDVLLHLGTLMAVFIAFGDDIIRILKKPFSKITYLIIVGTIPAVFFGFLLKPIFERAYQSLLVVGIGLIFTGVILKVSEYLATNNIFSKTVRETSYSNVLFIGLFQALAIIPGISRSGSTIAAGLVAGLDREFAARFSFLLSIPAILGAGVLQLKDVVSNGGSQEQMLPYLIGFLTAFAFSYLAIKVVMNLVKHGRLSVFSYYCWTVAALALGAHFFF